MSEHRLMNRVNTTGFLNVWRLSSWCDTLGVLYNNVRLKDKKIPTVVLGVVPISVKIYQFVYA